MKENKNNYVDIPVKMIQIEDGTVIYLEILNYDVIYENKSLIMNWLNKSIENINNNDINIHKLCELALTNENTINGIYSDNIKHLLDAFSTDYLLYLSSYAIDRFSEYIELIRDNLVKSKFKLSIIRLYIDDNGSSQYVSTYLNEDTFTTEVISVIGYIVDIMNDENNNFITIDLIYHNNKIEGIIPRLYKNFLKFLYYFYNELNDIEDSITMVEEQIINILQDYFVRYKYTVEELISEDGELIKRNISKLKFNRLN